MNIQFTVVKDIKSAKNDLFDHAIIGISPFNSYFSEENITDLIKWSLSTFKNFHLFIPDGWSIYTLLGQGYDEKKARVKTKKCDMHLRNKVVRAFKNNNIPEDMAVKNILMASTLMKNETYQKTYSCCMKEFNCNPSFREICLKTSRTILSKSNEITNEESLHMAVQYLLHELPLYLDTPKILAVPSSFCVYHDVPNFISHIYKKDGLSSLNQGFMVANVIN